MKIFLYKHLQGIKVLISAEIIIIDEYVKYQFKILGVWSFVSMIPSKQKGSDRELIQSTLLMLSRSRMDLLKHYEISVLRHIRFAELRKIPIKQPDFTNKYVI